MALLRRYISQEWRKLQTSRVEWHWLIVSKNYFTVINSYGNMTVWKSSNRKFLEKQSMVSFGNSVTYVGIIIYLIIRAYDNCIVVVLQLYHTHVHTHTHTHSHMHTHAHTHTHNTLTHTCTPAAFMTQWRSWWSTRSTVYRWLTQRLAMLSTSSHTRGCFTSSTITWVGCLGNLLGMDNCLIVMVTVMFKLPAIRSF